MAFLAGKARLDMSLMREVYKVRYIVHFDPRYRFLIFPVRGELQDFRFFANARHGRMTTHAFADAGYAGDRRSIRVNVTMLARNLIIRCMYSVTEFDGLNRASIGKIFAMHPRACQQPEQYC